MSINCQSRLLSSAAAAAVFVLFGAAQAEDLVPPDALSPDPGLSYAVKGVAAHDRLNVRSHPGAGSEIVGSLAYDARGILLTGRRMTEGSSVWWETIIPGGPGGTGWINHRYLAAEPGDGQPGYPLQCVGTEPFWSLKLTAGSGVFSDPDGTVTLSTSGWIKSRNSPAVFAISMRRGDADRTGEGYTAVRRASCSDGMSDFAYPFEATVILPDQTVFDGCCSRMAAP